MKTRNRVLYWITGAVLAVVTIAIAVRLTRYEPPQFHKRRKSGDFVELLAVPPTSAYGSSINLWVYEDDQRQPQEIVITGHADQNTCAHISRLLFSTAIQKNIEPEDLVVAGAARLRRHESVDGKRRLEQIDSVREYMALSLQRDRQETTLTLARLFLLQSSRAGQSALREAAAALAETERRIKATEENSDVKAYLRETRSGVALPMLIREASRIEQESGLVHVHHIPQSVATEVRERIRRAAANANGSVVTFNDLLKKIDGHEAAVLVNTLQTGVARPLSLSLPLDELSADNFDEVRKLNRGDIESAMIGDARERLHFYAGKHTEVEDEMKGCAKMSPEELKKPVVLNERCTPEGLCFPSDKPITMTRGEYCAGRVPLNLRIVEKWTADAEKLMQDINDDDKRETNSHAEAINHATLVDSMLRDWDLPVARDQRAFDVWRQERRRPVWQKIAKQLHTLKVDPIVISGENVVFAVRTSSQGVTIQPVQIVDLARSVVVADPKAGATRVLDAWQKRELKTSPAPKDRPQLARNLLQHAIAASQSPATMNAARDGFRQAFAADPRAAAAEVMKQWQAQFPPSNAHLKQVRADVGSWAKVNDFVERFDQLTVSPEAKESPAAFIQSLRALLKANPDAPPEYSFALAFQTASVIKEMSSHDKSDSSSRKAMPFDIIVFYADEKPAPDGMQGVIAKWRAENDATAGDLQSITEKRVKELVEAVKGHIDSAADPFVVNRLMTAAFIGEDPAAIIFEAAAAIQKKDTAYWQRAIAENGIPHEPSAAQKQYEGETRRGRDPITREAISLVRMDDLLEAYNQLLQSADRFFTGGSLKSSDDAEAVQQSTQLLDTAASHLDAAIALKSISGDEDVVAIRKHLEELKRASKPLDTLTRVELGTKIKIIAERLLLRAHHLADETEALAIFPDHKALAARVQFEDGGYDKAFAALYLPDVPVALSSPTLRWTAMDSDGPWVGAPVQTLVEGHSVLVSTVQSGKQKPVLRLDGCNDAGQIAAVIQGQTFVTGVTLSSQILLISTPLDPAARRFRDFVTSEPQRSILLKAMVYGCAAPGFERTPNSERCDAPESDQKDAPLLAEVVVPSLDSVRNAARSLIKER